MQIKKLGLLSPIAKPPKLKLNSRLRHLVIVTRVYCHKLYTYATWGVYCSCYKPFRHLLLSWISVCIGSIVYAVCNTRAVNDKCVTLHTSQCIVNNHPAAKYIRVLIPARPLPSLPDIVSRSLMPVCYYLLATDTIKSGLNQCHRHYNICSIWTTQTTWW